MGKKGFFIADYKLMYNHFHNAFYDDSVLPVISAKIDLEALNVGKNSRDEVFPYLW